MRTWHSILVVLSVVSLAQVSYCDSLVWWRFEDGSPGAAIADVKDFGNDGMSDVGAGGSPQGGVVYGAVDHGMDINGLPDRVALDMDGTDDYITDVPFPHTFTLFDTFTIEAIVLWRGIVDPIPEGKRNISMILQQLDGASTGRSLLYIVEDSDPPTLRSFLGGGTTLLEGGDIPDNQWIYAGLTYEDGFVSLWLDTDITDGIDPSENYVTDFRDFEDNGAAMIIGRHKSLIDNFHGMISELRVTDSGYGEGPNPENPPNDHLTATPAANTKVDHWPIF